MFRSTGNKTSVKAFTLIELSIVLVIIGLVVGGILVGQDLIRAATVRAQISQIEKYQQAANTFRGKYGYLPGDIPATTASKFGFATRGPYPGQGDGNGILQSNVVSTAAQGNFPFDGEQALFWRDLSQTHLIDSSFTLADYSMPPDDVCGSDVAKYIPPAKIENNGYVYAWSGAFEAYGGSGNGRNYFGLSAVNAADVSNNLGSPVTAPLLTVAQAYAIDKKIDDALPQTGKALALTADRWASGGTTDPYYALNCGNVTRWYGAGDSALYGGPVTSIADIGHGGFTYGSPYTCFDGGVGNNTLPEQYSVATNASRTTCSLSFEFQ